LTGNTFVTGNADSYAGGVTASNGTSKTAVRDPRAGVNGVPGGRGAPAPVSSGPAVSLSRPPGVSGKTEWDCPFPPEADAERIDFQRVQVVVTVRPDGSAQAVKVLGDPGHGFGRAARDCAMRQRYSPGLDVEGRPVLASMPPIYVRFTR